MRINLAALDPVATWPEEGKNCLPHSFQFRGSSGGPPIILQGPAALSLSRISSGASPEIPATDNFRTGGTKVSKFGRKVDCD